MERVYIKDSLLFYSLKDVLYNEDIKYVYCNFNIKNTENILEEMLKTKIINKDGIYIPFKKMEWDSIKNYYMLNTSEIEVTLKFIRDNIVGEEEVRVSLDVHDENNIILVNEKLKELFSDVDNIIFYFKDAGTEA